jgi:hypothetical protein
MKMTPNLYKENLPIILIYKNGNDTIDAFNLKYNVSDAGKTITSENPEFKDLIWFMPPKPEKPDAKVSPEYLQEDTIFSPSMQASNPAPITYGDEEDNSIKAATTTNQYLLNHLDAILAHHGNKTSDAFNPAVDSKDNEKKQDIKFKKNSLFDDEDIN